MNYRRTVLYLYSLQKFGIKFGLSSTEKLLDRLGRPQDSLPILHLAGTNGKGSVGATVLSILTKAGYRVGFYTSPHLVSFQERFVINDRRISKKKIIELVERVKAVCDHQEPPTFFEFVTAMAFLYFAEEKIDLAIMETGMGGRLDATNVARPLLGVITNISVEHTEFLGKTLSAIAREKAGIIKPDLTVLTGEKRPKIRKIFEETALSQGGRLLILGRDYRVVNRPGGAFDYYGLRTKLKDLKISLSGKHQVDNAGLALAATELLADSGLRSSEEDKRQGLAQVSWPGRGEVFSTGPDKARIMLDGAHNPHAARTLAKLLEALTFRRLYLIIGIMADKDARGILTPLVRLADEVILARPDYFRASETGRLAEVIKDHPGPVRQIPDVAKAIDTALDQAGAEDLVLVTGSLFTIGEARAYLTGEDASGELK